MKYQYANGFNTVIAEISGDAERMIPAEDWNAEYTDLIASGVEIGPFVQKPAAYRTYKADIWRRATEEEAEIIDAQINAQPVKLRNMFRDCDHLAHADPYFAALKSGFVAAFGQARADELLAPSE